MTPTPYSPSVVPEPSSQVSNRTQLAHIISFDVEEYFQVEAARDCVPLSRWEQYECRLPECVDRILALLDESSTSGTFFVLGWVARREPNVVRRIARAGHEIASHGMTHQMLHHLSPNAFRHELLDSRKMLEDVSGKPVVGFRAPTFSVNHQTAWAFDVLLDSGYEYDSSVFPINHDRYGVPEAPTEPHLAISPGGGQLLELPPLTFRIPGMNLPVGGGGYARLFPFGVLGAALHRSIRQKQSAMIYLHPWELDPEQPVLDMPRPARWRHRVGLKSMEEKLRALLHGYRFTSVAQHRDRLQFPITRSFPYGRQSER